MAYQLYVLGDVELAKRVSRFTHDTPSREKDALEYGHLFCKFGAWKYTYSSRKAMKHLLRAAFRKLMTYIVILFRRPMIALSSKKCLKKKGE